MKELTQVRGCDRSFCPALPVVISGARSYFFFKAATRGRALNTPMRVTITPILAPVADRSGENSAVFDLFRMAREAIRILVTAGREKISFNQETRNPPNITRSLLNDGARGILKFYKKQALW